MATSTTVGNDSAWTPGANMFAQPSGVAYTSPGGFNAKFRFGLPDATAGYTLSGCRIFIGMTDQVTNVPTQSDGFTGNAFGLQLCTASGVATRKDTTFQIYAKNAASSGVTNTTIVPFGNSVYDLYLSAPQIAVGATSKMNWTLVNITSGLSATGSITTNIPFANAPMGPYMGIATWTSGTSAARNLSWSYAYVESAT